MATTTVESIDNNNNTNHGSSSSASRYNNNTNHGSSSSASRYNGGRSRYRGRGNSRGGRGSFRSNPQHKQRSNRSGHQPISSYNQGDIVGHNKNVSDSNELQQHNSRHKDTNNESKVVSDPKGKGLAIITESSITSNNDSKTSRTSIRSKKSSVSKFSLDEIKDLSTSITYGLTTSTYECMICCDVIRPSNKTWSCGVCWAVFHLQCTQKWAQKSFNDAGSWRCPGCQNKSESIPEVYKCFCGKVENPKFTRFLTPHSCGNACKKNRDCTHDCIQPCHPGPCPPCSAMGPIQYCFCGRKTYQLRCIEIDHTAGKSCEEVCGKLLDCGKHYCKKKCHPGDCARCEVVELQKCYCGQTERDATCGDGVAFHCYGEKTIESLQDWTGFFSCKEKCNRLLECGHHSCTKPCHPVTEEPEPCELSPSRVHNCPCGANTIESLLGHKRTSCTEEIPLCNNICSKTFPCGHKCQDTCHHGNCKPCTTTVHVKCRCGSKTFERVCSEVSSKAGDEELICDRICRGLRTCGKHQCSVRCCPSANKKSSKSRGSAPHEEYDVNHQCVLVCEASFEELTCHCGRTTRDPPIRCGTKIQCPYSCVRVPSCGHPNVPHGCHGDEESCPPCAFLVSKKCTCGKSVVKNISCHKSNVSCGQVCGVLLPCGGHHCKRVCHSGDCLIEQRCTQTCGKPKACGHPCSSTCHAPTSCPDTACQSKMMISCKCGHSSKEVICNATKETAEEIKRSQLECDNACAMAERNRKLANALGLSDRIVEGPFAPKYDEELLKYFGANKEWAKNIESTLGDFILKSDKPTLNLTPMKAPHRGFIHGLCAHYSLKSESVDVEPFRSVIIKKKADSAIPLVLLSQAFANHGKTNIHSLATSATSTTSTLE
ncbi:18869_t:CDS:10 [Dentiscutata erythropus]|uniref:18869_t:CDS:1 n=1 Tax=Dentiscutata erythropus TaxID=1348616 RepID=A0A9N9HXH3_9GLOM|nr:18869_t:CDS:10 [Dentiscutata erythropus]